MCMEDVRLGRRSGVAITMVTLPAAGTVTQICPQNLQRTHLAIYSTNDRQGSVCPKPLVPSATVGIQINNKLLTGATNYFSQTVPLKFNIQHDGMITTQPFDGVATDAADVIVMVVETFIEED